MFILRSRVKVELDNVLLNKTFVLFDFIIDS